MISDTKTMIDSLIQIINNRMAMVLQNDVNSCLLVSANHALRWALQSVVLAKKRFLQRYRELEEEAKLLSELEEE